MTSQQNERERFIAEWSSGVLAQSTTLAQLRENCESENARIPLPAGCVVEALDAGALRGERIMPEGAKEPGAILYHHGGGHVFGSAAAHRHLVARIADAAGLMAYNMDYPLAPEQPYPAGLDRALENYRFVLDQGVSPDRLIVAGDSAGGNLTVAMLLRARQEGLPMPAGLYLISPWLDLRPRAPVPAERVERDPLLLPDSIALWAKIYLGRHDPAEPEISPLLADVSGFPATLLQVGGAELLLEEALVFSGKLALAGVDLQLNVWKDQVHAWPLFHHEMPSDGLAAIAQAGAWIRSLPGQDR
jgi:acetyl esterase/lipase